MKRKTKSLFDAMPETVQKLHGQANAEQRQKARAKWWAENGPQATGAGQFKKLTPKS